MVESQCPRVQDPKGSTVELNGSSSVEGPNLELDPSAQVAPLEESLKDGQCGAPSGGTPLSLMLLLCSLLTSTRLLSLTLLLCVFIVFNSVCLIGICVFIM